MSKYYKAKDIIDFLNVYCPKDMWEYQIADLPIIEVREDAPSVVPSRAEGEWIKGEDILDNTFSLECPFCGEGMYAHYNDDKYPSYCWNCGAKMKGVDNE